MLPDSNLDLQVLETRQENLLAQSTLEKQPSFLP